MKFTMYFQLDTRAGLRDELSCVQIQFGCTAVGGSMVLSGSGKTQMSCHSDVFRFVALNKELREA